MEYTKNCRRSETHLYIVSPSIPNLDETIATSVVVSLLVTVQDKGVSIRCKARAALCRNSFGISYLP